VLRASQFPEPAPAFALRVQPVLSAAAFVKPPKGWPAVALLGGPRLSFCFELHVLLRTGCGFAHAPAGPPRIAIRIAL